jgi:hypothetical protein
MPLLVSAILYLGLIEWLDNNELKGMQKEAGSYRKALSRYVPGEN